MPVFGGFPVCFTYLCDYFCIPMAELSSCNRDAMAPKPKVFAICSSLKTFDGFCPKEKDSNTLVGLQCLP